ncbi:hypothetical protein Maes01_00770 [Microbulbifer aestuariivivens]|uniref:DUF11 domain-containing protein n=1 Tax=Microbulbifer aestuariivivens TaxID=1908308 RepID=A0ABP9WQ37_9GAMM
MNKKLCGWMLGCATLLLPQLTLAGGTGAGTPITNTATATFTDSDNNPRTVTSNTTSLTVDELLDVTVSSNDSGNVSVLPDDTGALLSFTVTNTGNGTEAYDLILDTSLTSDQFDPLDVQLFLDTNGDEVYDAADEQFIVGTTTPPQLNADQKLVVFVVSTIPGALNNGDIGLVELTAESITAQATVGADNPGSVFAGQGDSGVDAIVGSSGARASDQGGYQLIQVETTFTKSQSVSDPFGGTAAVRGSVITYTLEFEASGSGDLTGLALSDDIPDNTTYVPGSITLDGAVKTDAASDDEAVFDSSTTPKQIRVDIGTVTAPATHTVTFQVEIN